MQPTQRRFSMVYFALVLVAFFVLQAALEALARLLLEAEVVSREALASIVGQTRVRPAALVASEPAVL